MMHTKWNDWMAENLRYALRHNKADRKMSNTFAEYSFIENNGYGESYHWVDVVGKKNLQDSLCKSVVIEVKSGISDISSGYGQNFVGKYNFFAADYKFCDRLLEYIQLNADSYVGIGLLRVDADGTTHTILPSNEYTIESDFSSFCSDEEVALYFQNVEIPNQHQCDFLHRNRKLGIETIYIQLE